MVKVWIVCADDLPDIFIVLAYDDNGRYSDYFQLAIEAGRLVVEIAKLITLTRNIASEAPIS